MIAGRISTQTGRFGPRKPFVLLALLAVVVVMVLTQMQAAPEMAANLRNSDEVGDGYAFYTERYWQEAAERANRLRAEREVTDDEEYAFYTERYWQAEAARAAQSSEGDAGVIDNDDYAFYTERYWRSEAARAAAAASHH